MPLNLSLALAPTRVSAWSFYQASIAQSGIDGFTRMHLDGVWGVLRPCSFAFLSLAITLLACATCITLVAAALGVPPSFGAFPCLLALSYLSRVGFTVTFDSSLRAGFARTTQAIFVGIHCVVVSMLLWFATGFTGFRHTGVSNTFVDEVHGGF